MVQQFCWFAGWPTNLLLWQPNNHWKSTVTTLFCAYAATRQSLPPSTGEVPTWPSIQGSSGLKQSELRKAQALAPSGHERDEQLLEAWRHGEPTHSNTTFRVRISQHKLLGLFSLKILFGSIGGLTEEWGTEGSVGGGDGVNVTLYTILDLLGLTPFYLPTRTVMY